ncbi:hypothetical protein E1H99_00375 [Enterococcus hirae]|nr:hypothetical protein E1H99_00375 [Enterococcus hirae]
MLTKEEKEMYEQKAKEFEKRVNMLALSLSLKRNDKFFHKREDYHLLFSTYIKMLENDQNDFFVEKDRKEKIIESLERAKAFYYFEHKKQLQTVFKKLINDDPSDFILFPAIMQVEEDKKVPKHIVELTVYKKNKYFVVLKVDKESYYDHAQVSYFQIPSSKIKSLSQLLFYKRVYRKGEPFFILKCLSDLSSEVKVIPTIKMKKQTTGNCVISGLEASLRIILFNCRTDIFCLDGKKKVTLKWNFDHSDSTLEMRRRFLSAVKGENKAWNQHFDYLFDYYLYRKGVLVENPPLKMDTKRKYWYKHIRLALSMDLYIPEMLKNGGRLPTAKDSQLKENLKTPIGPLGKLSKTDIRKSDFDDLTKATEQLSNQINIFQDRFSSIKIQRAKKITQEIISRLKDKSQEIQGEIQQREKEMENVRQTDEWSYQMLGERVLKAISQAAKRSPQSPIVLNAKGRAGKAIFPELIEHSNKVCHEIQNAKQIEARNKKQSRQYEK